MNIKILKLATLEELEKNFKQNKKPTEREKKAYDLINKPFNQEDYFP
jgi:hypothetical protein